MPTYTTCPDDIAAMGDALLKKHHPSLAKAGVTVSYLFAAAPRDMHGQPKGAALKHHGWPAAAMVKINSLKDRVEGKADVTVVIDGDTWEERSEAEQTSILDHELTHLELKLDKDGAIVLDDANRPKLKIRLHDVQLGTFNDIARRYGPAALDTQHLANAAKVLRQLDLPWG